jgi:hypothetical protein
VPADQGRRKAADVVMWISACFWFCTEQGVETARSDREAWGLFVDRAFWERLRSHSWQGNGANSTIKCVKLCKQGSFFSICRVFKLPDFCLLFFCSLLLCRVSREHSCPAKSPEKPGIC